MSFDVLLARSSAAKVMSTFVADEMPHKSDITNAEEENSKVIDQPPQIKLQPQFNESAAAHKSLSTSIDSDGNNGPVLRKVSTSKLMSTLSTLYGGGNTSNNDEYTNEESAAKLVSPNGCKIQQRSYDDSFPEIKGRVESKLMSMWHNVKYG